MGKETETGRSWRLNPWRIIGWSTAAFLLLLPLVAMQFTDEVNWNPGDFAFAAVLILSVGIPLELVVRKTADTSYRVAVGVALLAAFLLVWINGAVGIIGSENNGANLMYFGVLAVGIVGAIIARLKPHGMAIAMFATALAVCLVGAIALIGNLGFPEGGSLEVVGLTGFFVVLFTGSALLFRRATETEGKVA